MATDDEGHTSSSGLGGAGLFAFNSQKLRNEYGYESEHALAVVAKTIIGDYYGQGPNYSYFDGCSDGGREAMEVAERYPTDFNGIIAGRAREHRRTAQRRAADLGLPGQHRRQRQRDPHLGEAGGAAQRGHRRVCRR